MKALDEWPGGGVVIKADGLAAGKGVVVCDDVDSARDVLKEWYGASKIPGGGSDVLLEEKLDGPRSKRVRARRRPGDGSAGGGVRL